MAANGVCYAILRQPSKKYYNTFKMLMISAQKSAINFEVFESF